MKRRSRLAAAPPHVEGDGRTVVVRLTAWDTPEDVTDDGGRTWYRERFARGSIRLPVGISPGVREHGGPTVGRVVALDDDGTGPVATIRVADTADGRDVLALVDEEALSVSMEFDEDEPFGPISAGAEVEHTDVVLAAVAFTDQPQHTHAAVLARRSHRKDPTMDEDQDQTTDTGDAGDDQTTDTGDAGAGDDTTTRERSTRRTTPRPVAGPPRAGAGNDARRRAVVGRFRSFGEFALAAANGTLEVEERQRYYRALQYADTADTTGLVQTQWIAEVIDLVRAATPTVQAFSQRPLPDKGFTVSQPTVSQRPTVGKQAAQGDAISSQEVRIVPTSWTVETYGGGQGMSVQALLRTDPSYLDEVMRLYAIEMGLQLETDVVAAVLAAADDVHAAVELPNTAVDFQDAFVDASALILGSAGLGRMGEVAVLNIPMWVKLAKAKDSTGRPLFPGVSMTNPQGSMDLTTTTGEVRSLQWFVAPKMATTRAKAVVGIRDAFRTMIGAPQTLQADVPSTLQHERAVFQFAAFGKVDARGLVLIDDAA